MTNGTLIAVHESTSEKNREKRTVEARYIFGAQSPSINQYTKAVILPLSHMKAVWADVMVLAPPSLTMTDTMMATAPSSETIVPILMISTKTTTKDTMTAQMPTAKTITVIGDQEATVTSMAKKTAPDPLSLTTIKNTAPEPSTTADITTTALSPL